ncbi:MAG: NAD(P)-binding domain-containing protein [candidate division KSB1 bacterium]|nr:NAD(P)-binding domain-containing protein [candidate division KSB1 bacterium]MDZ7368492.1 NAD(P)-binding domain-containing protein [candidate division KSB1 bacterium]MDZ7406218.1 NAD(P)-binding domain-containing protein [candidate division KSB1 bacterium]
MRILIASSIDPEAIARLREQHDVVCAFNAPEDKLKSLIRDREVLICRSGVTISAAVMSCGPALQLIIRAGSGTDNIDLAYVQRRGIRLERIPEPGAKAVAELAFALMLALARNLLNADRMLRQGHFAKHELSGYSLRGKVLGIIGAGNIGSLVGQMGAAWGMKVLGCVENPSPEVAAELAGKGIQLTDCDEVVAKADFLSLHVPLTNATRNMINAETLSRMKAGSYLINLARGGVVDEAALHRALTEGTTLRGAALDVHQVEKEGYVSPLAALPNVVLTPHIGAQTIDSQREIGERILEIMDSMAARKLVRDAKPSPVSKNFFPARVASSFRANARQCHFTETIELNLNAIKCFAF